MMKPSLNPNRVDTDGRCSAGQGEGWGIGLAAASPRTSRIPAIPHIYPC